MYTLKNKELFWDFFLREKSNGITLKNSKPVRKNIVMTLDKPYEGEHCAYMSLVKVGETFRIYYRGGGHDNGVTDFGGPYHSVFCVAESRDGKTFTRPNLGIYEFNGNKDNNIVFKLSKSIDNFSVYLDENPNCPPDEKYKALTSSSPGEKNFGCLSYYKSADGYSFEFVRVLPIEGAFDSLNLTLYDSKIGKYRIYFRNFHKSNGEDIPVGQHNDDSIRDIRMVESEDFITWSEPVRIAYTDGEEDIQYYTSGITIYPDSHMYFGLPVRYIDRAAEEVNYKHLPTLSGLRRELIRHEGRSGTAVTDCTAIFSRDGALFERSNEAFATPGIENHENWIYGDCYFSLGLFVTESDYPFEPNELSIYRCHGYRHRNVDVVRYSLRMDGFRCWSAGEEGGYALTVPLTVSGNRITVNFATSALGYLRIILCDEDGNALVGYDSGTLFGDSTERPIEFDAPLSEIRQKAVRLRIEMKECELYSLTVK